MRLIGKSKCVTTETDEAGLVNHVLTADISIYCLSFPSRPATEQIDREQLRSNRVI